MFPDLFSIGPLTLHTYGLFVALGFTAAILFTVRSGKKEGIKPQQTMDMGITILLWGIIGSRLMYVLINLSYYRRNPVDVLKIWEGGLVFSGGLIAVAFAMVWYIRRRHLSFWKIGDLWAPAVALGQGFGRIGCFMAGCCFGKPTDVPWGFIFTHPGSLAPLNMPIHPTQLYASLSGFVIFVILVILRAKKKFEGQILLWFLILHSTARLFIERYRADDRGMIPGTDMTGTQLVSLLVLMAAVIVLFVMKSGEKKDITKA
jgi:phosphatidylglycerol:prolipoprotein diacylglycerol transferase